MNNVFKLKAVAAILLVSHGHAFAWKNGFDPNALPAVIDPSNGLQTSVWKLTGVHGTQIAPRWFVSAAHVASDAGWVYTNGFGSAVIEWCRHTDYAVFNASSQKWDPDFVLCKLAAPINPPAGFVFPPIVENPNKLITSSLPIDRVAPQMGSFLVTGYGLPDAGKQRAAWLDFMQVPVTYSPELTPNVPGAVYVGNGDSGSAVFWLPPGKAEAALVATTVSDIDLRFQLYFDTQLMNWISTTIAANSTDTVRTIPLNQYFTVTKASPPRLDANSVTVASTVSGATVSWKRPAAASSTEITTYALLLGSKGANVQNIGVKENSTGVFSYTFNSLASLTDYTVCVVPMNGVGVSQLGEMRASLSSTIDPSTQTLVHEYVNPRECTAIYTSPKPDRVDNLIIQSSTAVVGKTTYPSFKVTWPAVTTPAGVRIQKYRVRVTEDGTLGFNDYVSGSQTAFPGWAFTTSGPKRICAAITPVAYNDNFGDPGVANCVVVNQ